MALTTVAAEVYRDYDLDGVPSSGAHNPKKPEIRRLLSGYENVINAFTSAGGLIYDTLALLNADLVKAANSLAWVISDTTTANNGIYKKVGASGTGSWVRVADLPYSFIVAENTGEGTANAIQASTSIPMSESALVLLNIYEANTLSPVTVAFNGGSAFTIKTNSGNDVAPGGLVPGMLALGRAVGSTFRLASDQTSSAFQAEIEDLLAQAEAARDAAADYANFARNNWAVMGPFTGTGDQEDYPLSIDPGSINNMFVVVGGVSQLVTQAAYSLVSIGGAPFIRISVPEGVVFEVRVSNAVPVGVPSDGSVTTIKLADDGVTFTKMQDISPLRLIGRTTAGAGDPEEVTAEELLDFFLPSGSVVQRVYVETTAAVSGTSTIPVDGTKPQITEGFQVLGSAFTPKNAANRIRISFNGWAQVDVNGAVTVALFSDLSGNTDASQAITTACETAIPVVGLSAFVEVPCVSTAARNISARAGMQNPGTLTFNTVFGGSSRAVLIIEEIKG